MKYCDFKINYTVKLVQAWVYICNADVQHKADDMQMSENTLPSWWSEERFGNFLCVELVATETLSPKKLNLYNYYATANTFLRKNYCNHIKSQRGNDNLSISTNVDSGY